MKEIFAVIYSKDASELNDKHVFHERLFYSECEANKCVEYCKANGYLFSNVGHQTVYEKFEESIM